MALLKSYVNVYGQLEQLFEKIREGQAPDKFTREFLKDIGLKSSNWHAAINLLKGLGFLSADGVPTGQYMRLLDRTEWAKALADAIVNAYSDIFVVKNNPADSDKDMIAGKFKSTYNLSDPVSDRCAATFLSLWKLADQQHIKANEETKSTESVVGDDDSDQSTLDTKKSTKNLQDSGTNNPLGLTYTIQIHLPATKDIEVFNAIFRSLRDHIID